MRDSLRIDLRRVTLVVIIAAAFWLLCGRLSHLQARPIVHSPGFLDMSPQQASPQHVTGEGKAAYNLMFFIGVFFMLTLAAAGFIFVYTQLPKRVKRCSIDTLRNAQELILFVTDTQKIVLKPDAPQFKEIIAHFTELRRPAENNVFSEKLIVKTGAGTYTLEVSMEGWNFLGEQRNSRRLNNPMEFMQALYSLSKDGSG